MWALRRAANPKRTQNPFLWATQVFCTKSDIPSCCLKRVNGHYTGDLCRARHCVLAESFTHRSFFAAKSFLGIRNLSSRTTGDNKDDDGFSDLDNPLEHEKVEAISDEKDGKQFVSEGELSENNLEDDSMEGAGDSVDLSEAVRDSNGEKDSKKKSVASPLFKVITESPRGSINKALDKWVEEGNPLGRTEATVAMFNLRKWRFYWKALQFMEWLEANKHLDFVEQDYASHLDLIAKVHGLQKAEKYIEKVPESFRGEILYRTLLANCVSAGNIKKAEELFNKMKELGLPITIFSCNQLLLLFKRVDRRKIADVLLMMEKENVKPSLFTYRLLIDAKGRAKDVTGMEQILETMKSDGMEPDFLIQAIVAQHYMSAGHKEKAETVLKEMEGDDIKENRDACKALLPLYAALGKENDVKRIWKVCEASPRLDECLAAIEAWGKLGRIEDAEEVFESTLKSWKKLSSKYYNALLKVYANHKLLSKGKDLAKKMSDNGCRIGPLTWDALVRLYVEAGEVEKADSILQKAAQQNQNKPLYSSYMMVLEQYSKRGDVHNAEKIFLKLRQSGYILRIGQYQLLLQAYINSKTLAYGFRERMKADNLFPNKQVADQLAAVNAFRKGQISELLD